MSFHESNFVKFKKLIDNPRTGVNKIIPFIKSKLTPYYRDLLEFFNIDSLSKPYTEQQRLLYYINKKNGFFVECGGNDGYNCDPTYYMEKFSGWKGIIIEPLPIGKLCVRNRKKSKVYQAALVPSDFKNKYVDFVDCNTMSFIDGSIEDQDEWIKSGEKAQQMKSRHISVPAVSIQKILEDYEFKNGSVTNIDFFVIDVEGYELEVLKGLDFKTNSPSWIMAEAHTDEKFSNINSYLEQRGYDFVSEIGYKDFLFKLKIK